MSVKSVVWVSGQQFIFQTIGGFTLVSTRPYFPNLIRQIRWALVKFSGTRKISLTLWRYLLIHVLIRQIRCVKQENGLILS